jgi:hypothetical protein
MESEKSADLTIAAKKIFEDLLDSYKVRESAIEAWTEQAKKDAEEILARAVFIEEAAVIKSKEILDNAEFYGKGIRTVLEEDRKNWEEEKRNIARTYHFENSEIKLDIGGQCFTTTLTTLARFPDTMIGAMFSGRHDLKKNDAGAYFIDRDGTHFRHILNFLRSPENHILKMESNLKEELQREAEFYGVGDLMFPALRPAVPISVSMEGLTFRITQDAKGMWSLTIPQYSPTPRILRYCMYCEIGWILDASKQSGYSQNVRARYPGYNSISTFNEGREILSCQPTYSAQEPCPSCLRTT